MLFLNCFWVVAKAHSREFLTDSSRIKQTNQPKQKINDRHLLYNISKQNGGAAANTTKKKVILGRKSIRQATHVPPVQCVRTWGTKRWKGKSATKSNRFAGKKRRRWNKECEELYFYTDLVGKGLRMARARAFRQLVWQLVSLSFACVDIVLEVANVSSSENGWAKKG